MGTLVAVALIGMAADPAADEAQLRAALVGTWENTTAGLPPGVRQIKHVTPTHYTWVTYDVATATPSAVVGGTWALADGKFRQKNEFASGGYEGFRGKETTYDLRLADGKWFHSGVTSTGFRLDEVWSRVPADGPKR